MWTLSQIIGMGILCSFSVTDIQFRRIPAELLAMTNLAVVVYQICLKPVDMYLSAAGAGIGILFLLCSKATRQAIGYADSWAILILGIFLGLWGLVAVLSGAFFLLVLVSMWLLFRRKMRRSCRLPFYPFLAAGYVISICVGGPV